MTDAELLSLTIALYNKERRVGWDPAWINAEPTLWRSLEERVRNGERA